MAETSELIEFRRAFVWLLCGMLLPSVALVAFGVVAVANERAAVERRLAEEYGARLQALQRELRGRLDEAAASLAATGGARDALIGVRLPAAAAESHGLGAALKSALALPPGGNSFAPAPGGAENGLYALVRVAQPEGVVIGRIDAKALATEVERLPAARTPRERAIFRLGPAREGDSGLTLR